MPSRQQLEELVAADPNDPFARYALAKQCINEQDSAAGIATFEEVIRRHPDYVPAYFQLAQTLATLGKNTRAREVATIGIEVAKKVGDSHAEGEMSWFLGTLS